MDLNAIVQGFATKIRTSIPELNGDGYPMTPPVTPGFEIDFPPEGLIFNATFGNKTNDFDVILRVFVSGGDVDAGVKKLYTWLSDSGITYVLNADKTLGNTVENLFVRSASVPLRIVTDNTLYLAAEWRVNLTVASSG